MITKKGHFRHYYVLIRQEFISNKVQYAHYHNKAASY